MAGATSSKSYEAIGNREDLTNIITNISPLDTYLVNRIGKAKVKGTKHEWQTETLAPAQKNAVKEITDYGMKETRTRKRIYNEVQNFIKEYYVSETQEAVDKAGISSEIAHQRVNTYKTLNKDMEFGILSNDNIVTGDDATAPEMGGIKYWHSEFNNNKQFNIKTSAAGLAPTGVIVLSGTDHKIQDGDIISVYKDTVTLTGDLKTNTIYYARVNPLNRGQIALFLNSKDVLLDPVFPGSKAVKTAFANVFWVSLCNIVDAGDTPLTEDLFSKMMFKIARQGGTQFEALVGGKNKRAISKWTTGVQKTQDAKENRKVEKIDIYESDFGIVSITFHPLQDEDRVDFIDTSRIKLGTLLDFKETHVGKKGTYEQFAITGSVTIQYDIPQSGGTILNIKN